MDFKQIFEQIFESKSLRLFWEQANRYIDQAGGMNTGIISMLTDEELSIARQYLLHRLKKEAEWLLHCAEKPLISLVKDSGEKVKRIAELLYTIFIEEEIRKERIS